MPGYLFDLFTNLSPCSRREAVLVALAQKQPKLIANQWEDENGRTCLFVRAGMALGFDKNALVYNRQVIAEVLGLPLGVVQRGIVTWDRATPAQRRRFQLAIRRYVLRRRYLSVPPATEVPEVMLPDPPKQTWFARLKSLLAA